MMRGELMRPGRPGLILPPSLVYPDRYDAIMPGILGGIAAGTRFAAEPGGGGGLQDEVPSTCFHLDATISDSYPGSGQIWANLVESPADGADPAIYDMRLGNTTGAASDDPSFTGSANDPSAYFALDGGDFFSGDIARPGMLNTLTHTGTSWWLAIAGRWGSDAHGAYMFDMGGSAAYSADRGVSVQRLTTSGGQWYVMVRPTTQYLANYVGVFPAPTNDFLFILSGQQSGGTGGTIRAWVNTRDGVDRSLGSWGTNSTAVVTQRGNRMTLFGAGWTATNGAPNNSRMYAFAGGNAFLDGAGAGKLIDYFNAAHNRTYA